ncbi:hypothetical protein BGW41_006922 [Actinomortierella wolfii]|nr:hypothetical protein BGW41_006922 [Actinomortierella wolfii]
MSLLLRSTLRLRSTPVARQAGWTAVRTLTFLPTYVAEATVVGARGGHLTTKRGSLDLKLDVPKELGAKGGPGTNPEELLGGGYAACFGGALGAAARNLKMKIGDPTVTAVVSLGPKTPKGFQLAVELQVANTGLEEEEFEKLVKEAHEICPFSHALRAIDVVTKRVKA